MTAGEDLRPLMRRADDMLKQHARGDVTKSPFLTPREAHAMREYLKQRGAGDVCLFWGGYRDAERTRLFLLPRYVRELCEAEDSVSMVDMYTDGAISEAVTALLIRGSGYRDLSHRDYLGSLLGLGIRRETLGDIVKLDTFSAVVFCDGKMAEFISGNLSRVGNDAVKLSPFSVPDGFGNDAPTVSVQATVASERLDCVVCALTGMSREEAASAIQNGNCEVEFEPVTKPDREIVPPCRISVRGCGRFRVISFDGETRKGRLRLNAEKFV